MNECPPILFLIYKRPEETAVVFETIQRVRPKRLYVAADGPKSGDDEDIKLTEQTRKIISEIDWDCELKTRFRDGNLGCKIGVSNAISWFFEHEEEGIILEDDCVPDLSFFRYCRELLEVYRHDSRIMAISGDNFQQGRHNNRYSYYFSRYNHVWGWASWRRAWSLFDRDLVTWPEAKANGLLEQVAGSDSNFIKFWSDMFDKCYAGEIDTWGYPWMYSCWVQSGLTILPNINLVSNIGFGTEATHTKDFVEDQAALETGEMVFPLKHPPWVVRDVRADRFMDQKVLKIGPETPKTQNWSYKMMNMFKRLTG